MHERKKNRESILERERERERERKCFREGEGVLKRERERMFRCGDR